MSRPFYETTGYDIQITLGNMLIDTTLLGGEIGLTGNFFLSAQCNQARICNFSIVPEKAPLDLHEYQGLPVNVLIKDSNGEWHQAFKGFVDTPHLNFTTGIVDLECSDARANRIIQLSPDIINNVGSYSEAIFGKSRDKADEMEKRLQTVTASFDFDAYGNPKLTPWAPASTANFSFYNADVSNYNVPDVRYANRDKTINTIDLDVTYTYQRLHQQTCSFVWNGYSDFNVWFNNGTPSFPAIATIESAVKSGQWKVVSGINYTRLWEAGFYNGVQWQPNDVRKEYKGRTQIDGYLKDGEGNWVTAGNPARLVPNIVPVLDANGKQIMDVIKTTITDTSSNLCRGANWTSAIRFAQTVTESYHVRITAPQSADIYGAVLQTNKIDLSDQYDTASWEQSNKISFSTVPFYINKKINPQNLLAALQVGLNMARHDILDQHRDTIITWQFSNNALHPEIDLHHTVYLEVDGLVMGESKYIKAKGKIDSIKHSINFATYEASTVCVMRLSRATGSATNSPWQVQVPADNPNYIGTGRSIALDTHVGINPDPNVTSGADKWTGWIGNKTPRINNVLQPRTNYQESFVVDFPEIPSQLRDTVTYVSDNNLTLEIPNDYMELST